MNEDAQRSTNRTKKRVILSAIVILLIAATAAGSLALASGRSRSVEHQDMAVPLVQSHQPPPSAPAAAMIRHVLPSVVNVRVTQVGFNPFAGPQEVKAEGSGVILSSNGTCLGGSTATKNIPHIIVHTGVIRPAQARLGSQLRREAQYSTSR